MELRQLRYFVTVAEELHFGRAAERLHIVQPAVSQQLRRLERELGVALFDRTTRSVRLTEAGQHFLPYAQEILAAETRAREAIAGFRAEQAATIRLGVGDGFDDHLDRALTKFASQAPDIHLQLVTAPAEQRLRRVRSGELDAALVRGEWPRPGLRFVPAWDDEVLAALPSTHPLAAHETVDFAELAKLPLRLAGRTRNPTLYDLVLTSCRQAGFEPIFGKELATARDTLAAVAFGKPSWTVLYAAHASRLPVPGVVFLPLRNPTPRMRTFVVVREDAQRPELGTLLNACACLTQTQTQKSRT